ncbi:MAG: cell filamentation protein Fic, partial [Deltaproteobacteria bacterium]|nr:cell filamentation protein Fic [Deltaproteobacteria bacterium]
MAENTPDQGALRKAGYAPLIEQYELNVIPNWHTSWVATGGMHRITSREGVVEEIYPSRYWPGDTLGDHLEFAVKYDGINLGILASLFQKIEQEEFLDYVRSKPTGKYARRLWFLYEFLTGRRLPLEDLDQGNYVDLLDPERYYAVVHARRVRRQRINDNLLGGSRFCPIVRRTDTLRHFEEADLPERCRKVVSGYPLGLLKRAVSYLYT